METQDLKALIRDTVRDTIHTALREERITLWFALLPQVSDREMKTIEAQFGIPTDYQAEETLDMTDWIRNVQSLPSNSANEKPGFYQNVSQKRAVINNPVSRL